MTHFWGHKVCCGLIVTNLKVRDWFYQQNTTKQDDTLLRSQSVLWTHLYLSSVGDFFFVCVSLKSSWLILSAKYHEVKMAHFLGREVVGLIICTCRKFVTHSISKIPRSNITLQGTATHCNILQHTATVTNLICYTPQSNITHLWGHKAGLGLICMCQEFVTRPSFVYLLKVRGSFFMGVSLENSWLIPSSVKS